MINTNINLLSTWVSLYLLNKIILINFVFSCMILYKYIWQDIWCYIIESHLCE